MRAGRAAWTVRHPGAPAAPLAVLPLAVPAVVPAAPSCPSRSARPARPAPSRAGARAENSDSRIHHSLNRRGRPTDSGIVALSDSDLRTQPPTGHGVTRPLTRPVAHAVGRITHAAPRRRPARRAWVDLHTAGPDRKCAIWPMARPGGRRRLRTSPLPVERSRRNQEEERQRPPPGHRPRKDDPD